VSESVKQDLLRSGISGTKIVVIKNSVNTISKNLIVAYNIEKKKKELGIAAEEFVCGYVGRLSKEKGLSYLIQALTELSSEKVPIKLIVLGDGPQRESLISLAKRNGVEERIIFLGFKNNIEEWVHVSDCIIMPSLTEGTPMALLEAMSMGLPVIATSVGGVPNIIKHYCNGILVQPGNYQAISKEIKNIINNQQLREKIGLSAKKTIKEKFDFHVWCRKVENLYEEQSKNIYMIN
jgi:glycosyltransferase involved in cell wall biosynthesis